MKRIFDIVVSTGFLLILFIPMLIIACMVRWKLGSPVIFMQQRPGRRGKPFFMFKFRTMTNKKDYDGKLMPDADRLTPFGQFLRQSSLDELPEFLNVLRGDMSLVGPRPLLMRYLSLYTPEQGRRHEIRPGITGWAQVKGRNTLSWEDKFRLDVWYVDHQTWWLDIKILFLTVWKIIRRDGISAIGSVTMHEFIGSDRGRPS